MHHLKERTSLSMNCSSCETALIKIYIDVLEELTPKLYAILTFLVCSDASDKVDRNILIKRLKIEDG